MSGPSRTSGGESVNFTFDGRVLKAREGDTLAAALLANGIGLVGRSFKYHRPRGILTAGVEEPNALVTVGIGGRTAKLPPLTMARFILILKPRRIAANWRMQPPSLHANLDA